MKRTISILIAFAVIMLSVPSFADTVSKFNGGLKDVVLSPLVLSDNVKAETTNAKFFPLALVGGFMKGSFYMAKQIVTGTYAMITSPIDMVQK